MRKLAFLSSLGTPVKIVLGSILLISVFTIGMTIIAKNRQLEYQCKAISGKKGHLDSIFKPVEIFGIVHEKNHNVYGDHDNYDDIIVEQLTSKQFVGQDWRGRALDLSNQQELKIGCVPGSVNFVEVGDTFVKSSGEYHFVIRKKDRRTFLGELGYYGICQYQDCIYERKGDSICFYQ